MKPQLKHPDCSMEHVGEFAALLVWVESATSKGLDWWKFQRCDQCDSLGRNWTDQDVVFFLRSIEEYSFLDDKP